MTHIAIVRMIAEAFGVQGPSEGIITLWTGLLSRYPENVAQRAAVGLIRHTTDAAYGRMPLFGLMQRELDAVTGSVRGEDNVRLQAEAEWDRLMQAIPVYGAYRAPHLHPVTAQTVDRLGGWGRVCSWREDELPFRRRDFIDLWQTSHDHGDVIAVGADAVAALEMRTEDKTAGIAAIVGRLAEQKSINTEVRQ